MVKRVLKYNTSPKRCFQGKIPGYSGFLLDSNERKRIAPNGSDVIFPYLTGRELLDQLKVDRWVIDFGNRNQIDAASFASEYAHVRQYVLPEVKKRYDDTVKKQSDMMKARKEHVDRWWQFWNRRDELSYFLLFRRMCGCKSGEPAPQFPRPPPWASFPSRVGTRGRALRDVGR